mmetsp:Transcript_17803/g.50450  ORF Transcript_17803/g.50450 Transcript_17803/m.50450 type:complete len:959 (+) Transcript_17803:209-3085(+)
MSSKAGQRSMLDSVWEYILNDYEQKPRHKSEQQQRREKLEYERKVQRESSQFESWFSDEEDISASGGCDDESYDLTEFDRETSLRTHHGRAIESRGSSATNANRGEEAVQSLQRGDVQRRNSWQRRWKTNPDDARVSSSEQRRMVRQESRQQQQEECRQYSPSKEKLSRVLCKSGSREHQEVIKDRREEEIVPSSKKSGSKKRGIFKNAFRRSGRKDRSNKQQPDLVPIDSIDVTQAPSSQREHQNRQLQQQPKLEPLAEAREEANNTAESATQYMDPFTYVFGITDLFDPWEPDKESDCDENESQYNDGNTVQTRECAQSTQKLQENITFTEIRLQHTPYRVGSDEEDFGPIDLYRDYSSKCKVTVASKKASKRMSEGSIGDDGDADRGLPLPQSRDILASNARRGARRRGHAAKNQLQHGAQDCEDDNYDGDILALHAESSNSLVKTLKMATTRQQQDRTSHSDKAGVERSQSVIGAYSDLSKSFSMKEKTKRRKGKVLLKKLACWSSNKHRDDVHKLTPIASIDQEEVDACTAEMPKSRVVPDNSEEKAALVTSRSNASSAVPTSQILQSKGPQSVYDYEYGAGDHMSAVYSKFSRSPKADMATWKFTSLPKASVDGEKPMVVIQVEASTVSETDCIIRRGDWWRAQGPRLPNSPGVDMVGKIFEMAPSVGDQYMLKKSQTVLSLTTCGGNSRFVKIHPSKLVKVPSGIDPAEAACLPETYLAAFQVLHFGQTGETRYSETSLKGRSILIVGSMSSNLGQALIDLAMHANAAVVYATAKSKHWKHLASLGVVPLGLDVAEWIMRVEGSIDLVLATNGGSREDITPVHMRALRPKIGHLIMCGHRTTGYDVPVGDWKQDNPAAQFACTRNKAALKLISHTHSYDVFEQWNRTPGTCKDDLRYLLQLLKTGVIKPNILDRIPLTKIGKAHEVLDSKRLAGFLICEPWLKSKTRAVGL